MTRQELAAFLNKNVVVELADGTVLGGFLRDNADGTVSFRGLPAKPTFRNLIRFAARGVEIPYEDIEHVRRAR